MNRKALTGMIFVAACGVATPGMAADPEQCLDCHEPAEDWAGMAPDQLLAEAKDPGNKRHKDIAGLSDEELMQIISELMAK